MSITAGAIKFEVAGDGVTVAFTAATKAYATTDFKVYKVNTAVTPNTKVLQVEGVGYTASLSTTAQTATITYTVAPTATESSLIVLDVPTSQADSLTTNGKFDDEKVEDMSDKITQLMKQLEENVARCLQVTVEQDNPASLPYFGTTTGYLYWNGTSFEVKTPS